MGVGSGFVSVVLNLGLFAGRFWAGLRSGRCILEYTILMSFCMHLGVADCGNIEHFRVFVVGTGVAYM